MAFKNLQIGIQSRQRKLSHIRNPAHIKKVSGVLPMPIKTGYFQILTAALIWGTIGVFARWSGLTPLELSFFRLIVAGLAMYALLPREERLLIFSTREWLPVFLCGVLFAVDCLLFFSALQLTTISNAVIPYNIQPVFIALLTPVFFREKLELKSILAFLLSLGGVGLLLVPSVVSLSFADLTGISLALAGALLLAVIALTVRSLRIGAFTFVYYEMLIASLFSPVVAAATGYFLFGEVISPYTVVGCLLIILNGVYIVWRD